MSESGQQIQNQPPTDGYPGRDKEIEMRRSRWLIALLTATGLLVIMAVGAYFLLGRELFQRPFLVVAVLVAWLGALVGFSIASESGQGMWRGFSIRRSNHTVKSKGGHDG